MMTMNAVKHCETITNQFKEHSEVRGLIVYAYVRFDIFRKMYENLVGRDIIIQLDHRRRDEHNVDKLLHICWKEQSNN